MSKLKLACYWAAGCGGCDVSVLEIHENLFDLLERAEIVFWPCIADFKYEDLDRMADGTIDVCLFNGGIRTEADLRLARILRAKAKVLIAYGACAMLGGIPGLANLSSRAELLDRAYRDNPSTENPTGALPQSMTSVGDGKQIDLPAVLPHLQPLPEVVAVDYLVPGCPPTGEQTWAVCQAIVSGRLPPPGSIIGAGDSSVCDECPREQRNTRISRFARPHELVADDSLCLLEQGLICLGPATRSGCGARCLSANMPCRGCYGPAGGTTDQGAKMISLIGSLVEGGPAEKVAETLDAIVDPLGTFYRFSFPAALSGKRRS